MKILFTLLLLSSASFAKCVNKAPISAIKEYVKGVPVPGVSCDERPTDRCVCFDGLPHWDELSLDSSGNLYVDNVKKRENADAESLKAATLEGQKRKKSEASQNVKDIDVSKVKTVSDLKVIIEKLIEEKRLTE